MRRIDKERARKVLEFMNLTREQRERELINEQIEKFKARGGKIKRLQANDNNYVDFMSHVSPTESLEYLEA